MEQIRTKSRIFNLSASSFSVAYNGSMMSSGKFVIPNFILHNENVNHIYLSVSHAEVPNSFYLVNQYNNILNINNISYVIPVGNYNAPSLLNTLATLLPVSITVSYSSSTLKYKFTSTLAFTINYLTSTITRIMGLSRTANMEGILSLGMYYLTVPNCVNFLPTARLNFRSSMLGLENFHSNDGSNDVFLALQNNASQNGLITYNNYEHLKYHIDLEGLNEIDIRVTDDSNRELDFNGISWFLTLRVDYEYKIELLTTNFSKIIKKNNELLSELISSENV
jgi:hypothetical protein